MLKSSLKVQSTFLEVKSNKQVPGVAFTAETETS